MINSNHPCYPDAGKGVPGGRNIALINYPTFVNTRVNITIGIDYTLLSNSVPPS